MRRTRALRAPKCGRISSILTLYQVPSLNVANTPPKRSSQLDESVKHVACKMKSLIRFLPMFSSSSDAVSHLLAPESWFSSFDKYKPFQGNCTQKSDGLLMNEILTPGIPVFSAKADGRIRNKYINFGGLIRHTERDKHFYHCGDGTTWHCIMTLMVLLEGSKEVREYVLRRQHYENFFHARQALALNRKE